MQARKLRTSSTTHSSTEFSRVCSNKNQQLLINLCQENSNNWMKSRFTWRNDVSPSFEIIDPCAGDRAGDAGVQRCGPGEPGEPGGAAVGARRGGHRDHGRAGARQGPHHDGRRAEGECTAALSLIMLLVIDHLITCLRTHSPRSCVHDCDSAARQGCARALASCLRVAIAHSRWCRLMCRMPHDARRGGE